VRTLAQDFPADKSENSGPTFYVRDEAGRGYYIPAPDFSSIKSYLSGLDKGAPATPHSAAVKAMSAKPPMTRRRSWRQRDVTRALRAAKAAGLEARVEITPDGRLIVSASDQPVPSGNGMAKDAADVVLARLRQ
jgi:hypothetical protein